MIPSIFISSTIGDLRYLRDALRDAVADLAYHPVMSEHGEVGYLHPITAAESCYHSVEQCQMAVIIIGRRYGNPSEGGISVTHKELRTAREHNLPLIAFAESELMAYRDVYRADPGSATWRKFEQMDHPDLTFALIDEITNAESYNGLIPFRNGEEAKAALKLQIADFVGNALSEVISPMRSDIKDVLAEITTLRHELSGSRKLDPDFLTVLRFLIDDSNSPGLRYILEHTVGPIDKAIPLLIESRTFDEFVEKAGIKIRIDSDLDVEKERKHGDGFVGSSTFVVGPEWLDGRSAKGRVEVFRGGNIVMNEVAKHRYDRQVEELKTLVGSAKSGPVATGEGAIGEM